MDAQKLEARREAKKLQKELARIESEKNQKPVSEITINIEWKRSATWGNNPSCEARIKFKDGTYETSPTFKCSGCGYWQVVEKNTSKAIVVDYNARENAIEVAKKRINDNAENTPYLIEDCKRYIIPISNLKFGVEVSSLWNQN
jgi:hypothetical protein